MKTTSKLWALLLSITLVLGLIPGLSHAEENYPTLTDAEMQAAIDEFWASPDGQTPGMWEALLRKGLSYIGGKVGEKIEADAWDTLWNTIFGDGDAQRHQEIINKLNEINGKLDRIIAMLKTMQKEARMQNFKDSIQRKLDLMWKISNELTNRVREFDAAKSKEQKYAILDKWYNTTTQGADSFDLFTYYCGMLANTGGMNLDGEYFAQYDAYAHLYWDWKNQGIPFREEQREKDILLVTKMAAMNTLWLAKEKELGRYDEIHETKAKEMREAIDNVLAAIDRNPVTHDEGLTELHYDGRSMIFHAVNSAYVRPMSTYEVNSRYLKPGERVSNYLAYLKGEFDSIAPPSPLPGESFHLITKEEMNFLARMSKEKETPLKRLLSEGDVCDIDKVDYVVVASDKDKNQPVVFGFPHSDFFHSYRDAYFHYADITKTGSPVDFSRMFIASVVGFEPFVRSTFNTGRYPAIMSTGDNSKFYDTHVFYPIWVLGDPLVPGTDDAIDSPAPSTGGTVDATIESAQDGRMVINRTEGGPRISLTYDAHTAFTGPDGETATAERLIGHPAAVTYTIDDSETTVGGDDLIITAAYATQVQAADAIDPSDDPADALTVEGTVVRLESAAQIIGGNEDLVLDVPGHRYTFHLPDGLQLDPRIHEGATVRVTYRQDGDFLIAQSVDLISPDIDDPVGEPRDITGVVDHIDPLPGSGGLLVLHQPGGVLSLAIPQDLPLDDGIRPGATVRATYHMQAGSPILDALLLIAAPDPGPMPGPVPNPNDPDGPIPGPVYPDDPINPVYPQWAEGTITSLDDTPTLPGQPRTLTLQADKMFTITIPMDMALAPDIEPGAFVHLDFHEESGVNLLDAIMLLTPAPHDGPMPGPVYPDNDPMPGPLYPDNDPMPGPLGG